MLEFWVKLYVTNQGGNFFLSCKLNSVWEPGVGIQAFLEGAGVSKKIYGSGAVKPI